MSDTAMACAVHLPHFAQETLEGAEDVVGRAPADRVKQHILQLLKGTPRNATVLECHGPKERLSAKKLSGSRYIRQSGRWDMKKFCKKRA